MSAEDLASVASTWPWLAALIVLIVLVWLFVKNVWPILRKMGKQADDFLGEEARPGVPRRPGVMERLESQEKAQSELSAQQSALVAQQSALAETLEVVRHELFPNSGKSLRDKLDQTSDVVEQTVESLNLVHEKLDNDNNRIKEMTGAIRTLDDSVARLDKIARDNHGDPPGSPT